MLSNEEKKLYWSFMTKGDQCSAKGMHARAMYWYAKAYSIKEK